MQSEVLKSYDVQVRTEELYIGLARVNKPDDNPQQMYNGSSVLRYYS